MKYIYSLFLCFALFSQWVSAAEKKENETIARIGQVNGFLSKHLTLTGYVQGAYGYAKTNYRQGSIGSSADNQFVNKLAMFVLSGNINEKLSWMLQFEAFTACALETYIYWKPYSFFQVKAGQMKTCFTLENQISPAVYESVNWDKVAARLSGIAGDIGGNNGGRDIGIQVGGEAFMMPFNKYFLEYRVGVFNGNGLNPKDHNNAKDWATWITLQPLNGLKIGASTYTGRLNYSSLQLNSEGVMVPTTTNIDRNRQAVSLLYQNSNLTVRGEYIWGKDGYTRREGFYLTGYWFVIPSRLVLLAKVEGYDENKKIDNYETIYTLGTTYHVTAKTRFMLNYIHDRYRSGSYANELWAHVQIGF